MGRIQEVNAKNENKGRISKRLSFRLINFSSILIFVLALALSVNGATIRIQDGALNVSNGLLIDTDTLFVDSAKNKVGIGTTSPGIGTAGSPALTVLGSSETLIEVGRSGAISDGLRLGQYDFVATGQNTGDEQVGAMIGELQGNHSGTKGGRILLQTRADGGAMTNRMTIDNAGNVGIGTTTPSQKLEVAGNVKGSGLCIGADCRTSWPGGGSSSQWTTSGDNIHYASGNGGNVGIGDTSPSAKLTVGNGDLFQVISSGEVRTIDGTSSAPAYSFTSDTNLGIYRAAEDRLGFVAQNMALTSSATTQTIFTIDNTGRGDILINFLNNSVQEWTIGYDQSDRALKFSTDFGEPELDTSSVLTIKQNGNVGIGIGTNPTQTLTVVGTANITGGGSSTLGLVVDSLGRVGIGTGSPTQKLQIYGNTTDSSSSTFVVQNVNTDPNAQARFVMAHGFGAQGSGSAFLAMANAGGNEWNIGVKGPADKFYFSYNDNPGKSGDKMVIDSAGNVGIGDTTPDAKLDVAGEIRADGVSGDGTGKLLCIKSDGNFGTCSSVAASDGACTCG